MQKISLKRFSGVGVGYAKGCLWVRMDKKKYSTHGDSGNVLHPVAGDDVAAGAKSLKADSESTWFWNVWFFFIFQICGV